MIVALAGGVGGARLVAGLARVLPVQDLTVVVNTADDFRHLGLAISPDLDTVMYTLAGLENAETGWGLAGDTWGFMAALARLGGATWFKLGDTDLATHIERTRRLAAGETLSAITTQLCAALGVNTKLVPMSDDPIATRVVTEAGVLDFQDYFVRLRCSPRIRAIQFSGRETARPASAALAALAAPELEAIIICPSNPYVSIDPILAVDGLRQRILARTVPALAISPIVGGAAVKGPAAKMMAELGAEISALGVARHYQGLIDGLVLDEVDRALTAAIEQLDIKTHVCDTIMREEGGRQRLAEAALRFGRMLR